MNDEKINITLKKELNILIINDYPIMAEAYEKILLNNKQFICNLEISACYELAIDILNSKDYDILFIDLQLDSSEKGIGISGEKLAIWTRNRLPETKIMLIMSESKSRVNDIIKTIPHDGFLIKKDITSGVVLNAIEAILGNSSFYSGTIEKLIEKVELQEVLLDELDKKILDCLSNGVRTKNLVKHICLSLSAIEKRKSNIKVLFNVKNDEELLEKARYMGIIN